MQSIKLNVTENNAAAFAKWWRGSSLETYGIYDTFSRNNEYLLTFRIEKTLRNTVFFSFWLFLFSSIELICEFLRTMLNRNQFLFSIVSYSFYLFGEFEEVLILKGKSDAYKELICIVERVHFHVRVVHLTRTSS